MLPADAVVLITGATGTLGRVATGAFANGGARVAVVGTDRGRLTALGSELGLLEDRWVPVLGDLRSREAAAGVVATAAERFGRIDVLLHLVGGWAGGTAVVDLDHGEVQAMLDQHLWTTLNIVQAVTPGMVERGWGRILAVSSLFAQTPGPKGASYAVAKAAEETLLRSLAREVGGRGVTANVVVVRAIDGSHERETTPSSRNAGWTTPEEVSAALLFLASDHAAAINGATIPLFNRS